MSESKNERATYLGVGWSFFALAAVMWITMDSWAIALPFAALAVTFIVLGTQSKKAPGTGTGTGKNDRG